MKEVQEEVKATLELCRTTEDLLIQLLELVTGDEMTRNKMIEAGIKKETK